MKKKIILIVLVISLVATSYTPLVSATSKNQQNSKNDTNLADRVLIKIFTGCFYYDHSSPYPAFCAINIDGFFRGFTWKSGSMRDDFRSHYWSGFVSVGTHTLTVKTIVLFEGFARVTQQMTVDTDTEVIDVWINLW